MAIGGSARYFVVAKSEQDMLDALKFAKSEHLPWYVVGEGSNLIVNDKGFNGVIINIRYSTFDIRGKVVTVGAGHNLLSLIQKLNRAGLAGFERMAGIPGTVGGAIYGCAGAYGQEIKDCLASVGIWDGKAFRSLTREQCQFQYRGSIFKKHKNWVIVAAKFRLAKGNPQELIQISRDTVRLRAKKYWPGLKCPGSFFKNLLASDFKLPADLKKSVVYGKLPVGVLLERVGAKGMSQGGIAVAEHHANLIYNQGRGSAADIKKLSTRLKALVKKQFGIIIDEEVQYL